MAINHRALSISHLSLILLIITISACTTTPTMTSPIHYPIGPAHVRYGQILGIEYLQHYECSPGCNCPLEEWLLRSMFKFSEDGILWLDPYAITGFTETSTESILFNKGVSGLFGYGSWHDIIAPIEQIPFISPSDENITIQAIFIDGSVELTVKDSYWTLLPNEELIIDINISKSPFSGCIPRYRNRLINHGFIPPDRIRLCDNQMDCQ